MRRRRRRVEEEETGGGGEGQGQGEKEGEEEGSCMGTVVSCPARELQTLCLVMGSGCLAAGL